MSIIHTLFKTSVLLIHNIIFLYIWLIIIAAFLSFIHPDPHNQIVQFIRKATDPALSFIREKMPFVVLSGLDLSPLVIIFGLQFLDNFLLSLI